MRLLTHNALHSAHKAGVVRGYPLGLRVEKQELREQEFDLGFVMSLVQRINWSALVVGCRALGIDDDSVPDSSDWQDQMSKRSVQELNEEDEQQLRVLHSALLEVHILDGALICPESGREFAINDGIPNMLLCEDELPSVKLEEPDADTSMAKTEPTSTISSAADEGAQAAAPAQEEDHLLDDAALLADSEST